MVKHAGRFNCTTRKRQRQSDFTAMVKHADRSDCQRDNSSSSEIYPPWFDLRRFNRADGSNRSMTSASGRAAVGYTRHCKHTQTVLTARVLAPGPGWRPSPAAINCEHQAGRYGRKQPEEQVVQQELQYIS
ncbi:hypothetical protein B0H14DRAFT_2590027 [Mycena olivaceomarginata]|nr:hypothetical protein B0H14DRAFT_2590027 [Mycena olivaceomarginata]